MLDFLKKTEEQKENYWALLIEPEWVTTSIWHITDGKVETVSSSTATRWDSIDESGRSLIESIDSSLSSCTQNLPDDYPDPTKTVFGVPSSWLDGGNIKEEYLLKLKKICDELSLTPSGFVVLSEAISHFYKKEEETELNAVVVGISTENLDLSIFDKGKLVGTTNVMRSVSIEDDMAEGLSRLGGSLESFPPRIILFNQNEHELEEVKSSLDDSDWEKMGNSKFVHPPKVEIFDPVKKILAVSLAGGSELGEVSGVVDTKIEEMPIEEINNIEEPEGVTAEDLGFTVNTPKVEEPTLSTLPTLPKKILFKKPNIKFNFPKINFSFGNKPLIMIGVLVITLFFVGFGLWWFLPKAVVTIYVSPKKLEENVSLTIGKEIKDEKVEVTVNGEETKATTGTKTVGDKAKGTVKVQNGTAFPINLPVGTILLSSSDLKFVTTKSASISGALSPSSPGITTLDVEAGNIGSEYNLNKDEVFKVANYPKAEVDATATDIFVGGSSRQISAVSEDDRKKLLSLLKNKLLEEAKEKLNEKITEDMLLVDASFAEKIVEENYSNKVGDEATNLKLSLSLTVSSNTVLKKDLSEISKKSLEGKIPTGFVLRDDQISYSFTVASKDAFGVQVSANLLPSIDTDDVAKKIAGRYPNIAEAYLASIPGFAQAEIRMKPTLQGKLGTLPHPPKNISIEITSER